MSNAPALVLCLLAAGVAGCTGSPPGGPGGTQRSEDLENAAGGAFEAGGPDAGTPGTAIARSGADDGEAVAAEAAAASAVPAESAGRGRSMPDTPSGVLIDEQLAAISYTGIYEEPILLTDGAYEEAPAGRSQSPVRGLSEDLENAPVERSRPGEPFEAGGASRPSVLLLPKSRLFADLDGVAGEEAVVLLAGGPGGTQRSEDLEGAPGGASEAGGSGGSGSNLYVAVVGVRQGRAVNIGTALVGDRPQVRSMAIDGGRIRLHLVQQGPEDAACCPTRLVVRTWSLEGEELAEGEQEALGTLSLAELEGRTWVLRGFDLQEPLPEGIEITADFADGQITGSAGCNRYFAAFEEIKPGFVKVGPAGATRMMCPGEVMDLEGRYLEHLGNVTRYSFHLGDLILGWQAGGTQPAPGDSGGGETGILRFSPVPPAAEREQP